MKKKHASRSAFFNPRIILSFVFCAIGVFLTLLGSGAFSNTFAAPSNHSAPDATGPLVEETEELSPADSNGRFVQMIEFAEPGVPQRTGHNSGEHFRANTPQARAALEQISAEQAVHIQAIASAIGRQPDVTHHFTMSHSGVASRLTPEEAQIVRMMPGVASVERERVYHLDTFRSPFFIGADKIWDGTAVPGGVGTRGEGIVIADLDTGLVPTHPSYANDASCGHGVGGAPDKLLSQLDCSLATGPGGLCNGASPDDTNGHGSHTGSTAGGNVVPTSAVPPPAAQIQGIAPCANIRMYKVCPTSICPSADITAGINSVLLHGDVDTMNFSISGGTSPWTDNDRRFLDLVDAGIVVAASAGNTSAGIPNPVGQVFHRGPWVMTVAASTKDAGGPGTGDILANFSLRGPLSGDFLNIQKPDITAPGVNIYAAVLANYGAISGTSMSCPHLTGSAALVRAVHPTWLPEEVKSALMMTSFNGGFKENGTTPWDPDDVGTGRVDLNQAAKTGLVMNETFANFLAADPDNGGDPKTLNVPSVRDMNCTPSCVFTRTVRNTKTVPTSWTATGSAINPANFSVAVVPPAFAFTGNVAETQALTITVTPLVNLTSAVAFGQVLFTETGAVSPDERITVAIKGQITGVTPTPTPTPSPAPGTPTPTPGTPTPTPTATPSACMPVVLYDQLNNASNTATGSQNFEPANDASDDQAADDFVVPGGETWRVRQVSANGLYFNGAGPADSFNVTFYADAATLPGAVVPGGTFTNVAYFNSAGTFIMNLPPDGVTLSPGTYWISVQANMSFAGGGQWGWFDRTVQSNNGAAWQNPGGGLGVAACTSWGRRGATCGIDAPAPDQVFRLFGCLGVGGTPTPTPSPTPTPTPTPSPSPTFIKAINVNGNAETINGNLWTSHTNALATGFATSNPTYSTNIAFSPPVDAPTNRMLNTGIWCPACDVNFSQTLPNGTYEIYLWAVENYASGYRSYDVKLEGVQVASAIGNLPNHAWQRYGPYNVTVSDGALNANLVRVTGDPLLQGIEIWAPAGTPPPETFVKAININGNAETINGNPWTAYNTALANGFATGNLTYSTSITYSPPVDAPTGRMLNTGIWCPACDINFSQTITNGNYRIYLWGVENYQNNYRSYNVKLEGAQVATAIGSLALNTWQRYGPYNVTVSDGTLNVNLVRVTGDPLVQGVEIWSPTSPPAPTPTPTPSPAFIKAVNINGNAETISGNSWTAYNTALGSGFATTNLTYSTNIAFSPPVDAPTNRMLNTGIWCPACDINFSQTISNGNYLIYLWAVENYQNNYRSYNVKLEGVQVATGIGNLLLNTWERYGPYSVTVADGTLNVNLVRVTGDPLVQGVEIWSP